MLTDLNTISVPMNQSLLPRLLVHIQLLKTQFSNSRIQVNVFSFVSSTCSRNSIIQALTLCQSVRSNQGLYYICNPLTKPPFPDKHNQCKNVCEDDKECRVVRIPDQDQTCTGWLVVQIFSSKQTNGASRIDMTFVLKVYIQGMLLVGMACCIEWLYCCLQSLQLWLMRLKISEWPRSVRLLQFLHTDFNWRLWKLDDLDDKKMEIEAWGFSTIINNWRML